jgi:hypothetical protein
MVLLGVEAKVEARFGLYRDNANWMQDSCTVCAEHTIGSKIILDGIDGTARRRGSCGISFRIGWKRC